MKVIRVSDPDQRTGSIDKRDDEGGEKRFEKSGIFERQDPSLMNWMAE
jgi:hypothetical protein